MLLIISHHRPPLFLFIIIINYNNSTTTTTIKKKDKIRMVVYLCCAQCLKKTKQKTGAEKIFFSDLYPNINTKCITSNNNYHNYYTRLLPAAQH